MPPAMLQAYVEMMPAMLARSELAMLRASIYGAHWGQLKSHDRNKIMTDLERLARGGAPSHDGSGEPFKIRSADDANRFFNGIARSMRGVSAMSAGFGGLGEAVLVLRTDQMGYDRELDTAERKAEGFVSRTGSAIQGLGQSMTAAGTMMSTRVTAPIVGAGIAILATAGNFQAGMNRVRAVSGATGDQFDALQGQAKELGRTTQFSASQAADAMGFLAMAGFDANEILGAMPGTLNLAAAAQMDLGSAADIVSNILTGYGMEVSDLAHVNDVLVKAMTNANVDLTMLGESMKFAGPVAAAVGIDFEEAAAAIALMGNAGIQGSMAGTSLRGAITRLLNPTKEAAETISDLGLQVTDTEGNFLPLVEIVRQLEDSGANASDMMTLFGQRAGPAMQALVDQGADSLENFTGELVDSGGTAERIAAVQMEGLNGSLKALKSAFEGLMIAIAEAGLLDFMAGVIQRATGFIQNLAETDSKLLRVGVAIAGIAAAIGPTLLVLGKLIAIFGALANPVGLIILGIAGLGIAIKTNLFGIGDIFNSVAGAVMLMVDAFRAGLSGDITKVMDAIKGLQGGPLENAGRLFIQLGMAVFSVASAFKEGGLRAALDELLARLPGLLESLGAVAGQIGSGLFDALSSVDWVGLAGTLVTNLITGLGAVADAGERILSWFAGIIAGIDWTGVGTTIVNGILTGLGAVADAGSRFITWLVGTLGSVDWTGLGSTIVDGILTGLSAVGDFASRYGQWFIQQVQAVDWSSVGGAIQNGLSAALGGIQGLGDSGPIERLSASHF